VADGCREGSTVRRSISPPGDCHGFAADPFDKLRAGCAASTVDRCYQCNPWRTYFGAREATRLRRGFLLR
jgi:hypothetical protein